MWCLGTRDLQRGEQDKEWRKWLASSSIAIFDKEAAFTEKAGWVMLDHGAGWSCHGNDCSYVEVEGNSRAPSSGAFPQCPIDWFPQFPSVDFTANSPYPPYPSKRQCQQGQKREMDNFCWEPVPHCHTWARAAQRYWKMLEVDVWNVLLFQTFSASNVLMWLRPTVKESDPLTLGSSELRNHKGHRWNLYKLVASHCLQQVEEFRMIYLAVSNFKSSIVPNVPEQDPSRFQLNRRRVTWKA